ncbi:MAG: hypothetical protein AAGF46_04150 [Pseudomonadota bacterium]
MKSPLSLAVAAAVVSTGAAAFEQTIPVTAETEAISVTLWSGSIKVVPGSTGALIISGECDAPPPPAPRDDGLRVVGAQITTPEIVSDDDEISIRTRENSSACALELTAPDSIAIEMRVFTDGAVSIRDWQAAVTAWSASGDVVVENQSATFSVAAMSGTATVSLAPGAPAGESAVLSAGGPLNLFVAEGALPNLRAQARWGDVLTDLNASFEATDDGEGRWLTPDANADGPVLSLRSLDDDIIIRRRTQ